MSVLAVGGIDDKEPQPIENDSIKTGLSIQ
jgi:hypothetical protein